MYKLKYPTRSAGKKKRKIAIPLDRRCKKSERKSKENGEEKEERIRERFEKRWMKWNDGIDKMEKREECNKSYKKKLEHLKF